MPGANTGTGSRGRLGRMYLRLETKVRGRGQKVSGKGNEMPEHEIMKGTEDNRASQQK